jgi:FdhD protein
MNTVDQIHHYFRYTREGWQPVEAKVISEAPVSLTVNGEVWLTFMCTPADLEALAVGFLFNEELINDQSDIADVQVCKAGDNVDVWTNIPVQKPAQWQRTSGCNGGLSRGVTSSPGNPAISDGQVLISPDILLDSMDQLLAAQEVYREARGIHCSAISDGQHIIYQAEDIGRHNTLDKLAGRLLLQPVSFSPKIILTTGRISSEMMTKSARLGVDVVLSRTSPTTRSIEMADRLGITLVGYARRSQLFVYAHAEKLQGGNPGYAILPVISESVLRT